MIWFACVALIVLIVASFAAGYLAGAARWRGWEE